MTPLDAARAVLSDRRNTTRDLAAAAGLSAPTVRDYRTGYRSLDRAPYAVVCAWATLWHDPTPPDRYAAAYADLRDATPPDLWRWLADDPSRLRDAVAYYAAHRRGRPHA